MPNSQLEKLLKFANLQMAAEAFWLGEGGVSDSEQIQSVLERGNTHASRFMPTQAAQFAGAYEVLAHRNNEPRLPGGTGFSGTLFRNRITGELTLSFRSTEFIDDAVRDGKSTNELEIKQLGWAFGQIAEMEDWFASLRQSGLLNDANGQIRSFNVTGYSLGGHLATAFNILRREAGESNLILGTYTFNGAGTGGLLNNRRLTDVIADFKRFRDDPDITTSGAWAALPLETRNQIYDAALSRSNAIEAERQRLQTLQAEFAFDTRPPAGIQASLQYQIAALLAARETAGASNFPLPGGVNWIPSSPVYAAPSERFANMIEIVGSDGGNLGSSFISNSGIHYGTRQEIYIEDQPLVRGSFPLLDILQRNLLVDNPSVNDFGDTHSLVLLVDSLALMSALEAIDPNLAPETAREIYAAMSNAKADSSIGTQGRAEGDSLERTLDAVRKIVVGPGAEPTLANYSDALAGNTWHTSALREPFHASLEELTGAIGTVPGPMTLSSLATMSASEMATRARAANGLAYRYSLGSLNPFAILGSDSLYATHNPNGELDLYDPATNPRAGMTGEYIADRAAFLAWKNIANTANVTRLPGALGPDNWRFIDRTQDYKLSVVGQMPGGDSTAPSHLSIFGSDRADAVAGGTETDRLYGAGGTDLLRGGAANDYLEGGAGLDIYEFAASTTLGLIKRNDGEDTVRDVDGKGVLRYTYTNSTGNVRNTMIADASVKVNDTTWQSSDGKFTYRRAPNAEGANDLVVTFTGDAGGGLTLKDFRDGDFGIKLNAPPTRQFADATNTITGTDLSDSLSGTSAAEVVLALAGADVVHAGAGDDSVQGGDGADVLYGEDGGDRLYGEAGRDSVYGGNGDDELYGGLDADIVEGGSGADLLAGGSGGDVVAGGAGNDEVHSGDASPLATALLLSESEAPTGTKGEWVDGGEGDDTVVAGAGNDQVMGGGGADVLVGGAGDDNLVGDSERTLVHVDNWMVTRQVTTSGNSTNYQLIYNSDAQVAESPDGADDVIYGGAGADWVFAGVGGDFVEAGSGDDVAFGEAGSDALVGGAGNDVLIGDNPGAVSGSDEGGDYLDGGEGDDQLWGNGGDDVLVGGPGRDTLTGGAGKDLYVIEKGGGEDTIFDVASGTDDAEASVLVLGDGVSRDSIKFRTGSLVVDLGDGDKVHVQGFDQVNPAATTVLGAIQFADGTSMSYAEILAQGFDIDGTEDSDDSHDPAYPQLVGTGVIDRIHGLGGNDVLFGLAGDDVLSGDDGNDTLLGDTGDDAYLFARGDGQDLAFEQDATPGNKDRVEFAAGIGPDDIDATHDPVYPGNLVLTIRGSTDALTIANQFVAPDYQVEEIRFADGTVWTPATTPMLARGSAGADFIAGTSGPDSIEGLAGNDTLSGGAGNDVYRFARGDGQDSIIDYETTSGNSDTILFAADIAPGDVRAARAGNDLVLKLNGTADRVNVMNYFESDGATPYSVESIRFAADGTVWGVDAIKQLVVAPTSGNDSITGYAGDDLLEGLGGVDTISGAGGNDTLSGGAGDDSLIGGAGSDTYFYAVGDGSDTVSETGGAADTDVLRFAAGVAPGDVALKRSRIGNVDDLLVDVAPGTARLRVAGQFAGDEVNQPGVERIEFDTGTIWDRAAIRARVLAATAGADELIGFSSDDSINGLAGNDLIEGAAGNDTLYGSTGNDQVTGGLGDDTFLFNLGDGQDLFSDKYSAAGFPGGGTETLILGPGITPANVTATKTLNNELNLQVNGTSDLVRLSQYFGDDAIERIQFSDGTVWTPATVAAMFPVNGTAGNDTLTGSGLPDTINALQGNDVVYGGGGNDTIDGGLGYDRLYGDAGDDIINGGAADTTRKASSDTLYGGSGNDVLIVGSANGQSLYGEAGNDIYIAGSGSTWMEDTDGSNLLLGGSATDNIYMGDGNDLAVGGRGSDSYDGDRDGDGILGRDVLAFNKGDGQDNVWELDAASTISLGGGTLYSNLNLEVSTVSLKLNVATSSITFQRWYDVAPFATPKIKYLQIVIEGTKLYSPGSADPMRNQKVQYFDFLGLVAAFDAARAAGQNFNVADNLARFRLWGSNDVAFGGALAYQYAKSGSLGTLSYDQMRAVLGNAAFGNAAQPIVAPSGAAATAESVAMQDAGVATQPMTLAAASGTSEPAQVLPSDTNSTTPSGTGSAAQFVDLPDEWFAFYAPQENARSVASAWQRVARDLPAHLDRDGALDGAPPFVNGVRVSPAGAIAVGVTFDNGVGLSDAAAGRLRQFEGIKEGFALLA